MNKIHDNRKDNIVGFFRKTKPKKKTYDSEHLEPVIRKSICTGEETAGFRDKTTGQFREAMLTGVVRKASEHETIRHGNG